MYLHDILQVCLLSLQARYPKHTLDIDPRICKLQTEISKGWTALQTLAFFSEQAPYLLTEPASLHIDDQICAIFLLEYARDIPAITIHCRGKIPAFRHKPSSLQKSLSIRLPINA